MKPNQRKNEDAKNKFTFIEYAHQDGRAPSAHPSGRPQQAAPRRPIDYQLLLCPNHLPVDALFMLFTCVSGMTGSEYTNSDIVHQSVYELVHSEDREELQRQLLWNSFLPPEVGSLALQDALRPERAHLLERSFTVRFRCLLDNTSGFLRLDIRGRVKVLHGQNKKTEEPPLALFAICAPFGPPSLLEIPQKEVMFKSKHKLDLSLVSMDQRCSQHGGYDLVHYDDLAYVASAHQELLKTGASGMIAYRFQTKEGQWQWLQTSSRLVYKNSKPDFVISTHRPLIQTLQDATQDFLSTCRNKRRVPSTAPPPVDYLAADAVAAYTNLNGAYGTPWRISTYSTSLCTPPLDDRFLTADNLFHQYKPLSAYHYTPYAPNGFLEPAPPPPGYEIAPTYHRPPSRDYTYVDGSTRYMSPVATVPERRSPSVVPGPSQGGSSGSTDHDRMQQQTQPSEMPRQTVLMWGAGGTAQKFP
ncbi:Aryl hydrocarbon receptor [Eumeta japonica]|uniref:Aryl hydrocarbon receptor n=1 Tax=Eumeta variegata TaxID=151549 RepID=A0A4C1VX88_EUMVA|nr:Aryl hydrocarbon receptor [Eumeta japonica]